VSNANGWRTLGDMGYVDADGYLYLTDRSTFMIVSGGVNIYPQETENLLIMHPKVADAAVFGIPNADFGEEVKAVVQPLDGIDASPELAEELIEYCRSTSTRHSLVIPTASCTSGAFATATGRAAPPASCEMTTRRSL